MPSKRREIQDETASRHSSTCGSPKGDSFPTVGTSHAAVGSVLSSESVAFYGYPVLCNTDCSFLTPVSDRVARTNCFSRPAACLHCSALSDTTITLLPL